MEISKKVRRNCWLRWVAITNGHWTSVAVLGRGHPKTPAKTN